MKISQLDGVTLKKMIIAGSNELSRHKELINSLNVFPVPDGDTGTNMSLTVLTAAKELTALDIAGACDVAAAVSGGSLRGARGNSGVILSQLFRGFAKGVEGMAVINTEDMARAFAQATETAYKAVMKPKEGTILTVARAVSEKAAETALGEDDFAEMLEKVIEHGNAVLAKTMGMLPELKQAGVIDAGGKGLMCFLEGAYHCLLSGENVTLAEVFEPEAAVALPHVLTKEESIEFGYCTEFFINVARADAEQENGLKQFLQTMGDSIVVVGDGGLYKVHVHSNHPGLVLEHALTIGSLSNLKIENMRMQHTELIHFNGGAETEAMGIVAVAAGAGLNSYFEGLGADFIVSGGQTMNPSADDILAAVQAVKASDVFVLPNNKNIILAAKQAAELANGKNVHVLPTATIPQGVSAMVAYLPMNTVEENLACMNAAIAGVKTGQVTFAVRDSAINGREIKEGDVLCLLEGDIALTHTDVQEGAKRLLDVMMADGGDIVCIFYGEGVSKADADSLGSYVEEKYPGFEVECRNGAQPLYYYIFSVE